MLSFILAGGQAALQGLRIYRERLRQKQEAFRRAYLEEFREAPAPDPTETTVTVQQPTDATLMPILLQYSEARQRGLLARLQQTATGKALQAALQTVTNLLDQNDNMPVTLAIIPFWQRPAVILLLLGRNVVGSFGPGMLLQLWQRLQQHQPPAPDCTRRATSSQEPPDDTPQSH